MWIDEQGTIVRPAEPGWPGPRKPLPADIGAAIAGLGRARSAPATQADALSPGTILTSGQDREAYVDALRDWVQRGAGSPYALAPDEVVARSQPRPVAASAAAAHFELAHHLWPSGHREPALAHFRESHRLQPDNWTYRRQAWSLVGNEREGGAYGRFAQGPARGQEDAWPFDSDFSSDLSQLGEGEYYPKTL